MRPSLQNFSSLVRPAPYFRGSNCVIVINDNKVYQDRHHIPGEASEDSLFSTAPQLLYSLFIQISGIT